MFQKNYTRLINFGYVSAFIQNLYRKDIFYTDKGHLVWSMDGPDGSEERKTFEKFSDRFRRIYPGYLLDKKMHVVAGPDQPVINLKQLQAVLKSSDEVLWENSKWMFDGE